MSDGLDAKGRIELEVVAKNLNDAVTDLARLNEESGHTSKELAAAERAANRAAKAVEGYGKTAASAAQDVSRSAKQTQLYNQYLYDQGRALGYVKTQLEDYRQAAARAAREQQRAGSSRVAGNLSYIPENGAAPRLGATFGSIVDQEDKRAQQASRSYHNLSTAIDDTIAAREREGRQFSQSLRARMQEDVANQRIAESGRRAAESVEALGRANSNIITQRYALYDVATTYGVIAAALLGASGYAIKLAADFESAFTSVERTSDGSIRQLSLLRDELVELSTVMPLTFEQLSAIATLGNQLGIDPSQIEAFTQTVARFSTVTGISVEESAKAFGSLGELLDLSASDYERLGSAIALAGRKSVATEAEIVALTTRLAASASNAGFTAQEVVALSTALASLRVAPERAQGVMEIYFNRLNNALANGGERLETFAAVAGMTTDQVRQLVATDPNRFFRQFALGLGSLDPVKQTVALEALGLSGIRAGEVFGRVSGNLNVFDNALRDANQGFREGSELSAQYEKVLDDLNSQWQMLINSVNAFIATASGGSISNLAGLVGMIRDLVNGARELVANPVAQWFIKIGLGITAVLGAMFLYRSASALATASTYALVTAQGALAASGARMGIAGLVTQVLTLGKANTTAAATTTALAGAQNVAASSTRGLTGALLALGRALIIPGLVVGAIEFLTHMGDIRDAVDEVADHMEIGFGRGVTALYQINGATLGVQDGLIRLGNTAWSIGDSFMQALFPPYVLLKLLSGGAGRAVGPRDGARKEMRQSATAANDYSEALGGVGRSAGGAAREVRTLVDYANDLSGVFQRSFDLRFGGMQGLDTITKSWSAIRQAIAAANQEIADHKAEILGLTSDKAIREYWLSVAENYGDTLRAGELRAELADLDAELAKRNGELAKAQEKTNKTLVGNSDAAIENRAEILGLIGNYQSYITALASSGLSQAELAAKTQQLKTDFLAQATQLGYNTTELGFYAKAFDGLTYAINNVPRNVDIEADVNPAVTAIREFLAKVNSGGYGGGSVPISAKIDEAAAFNAGARAGVKIKEGIDSSMRRSGGGSFGKGMKTASNTFFVDFGWNGIGGWADGGYTGAGTKYQPAGIVHRGEYVFDAQSVRNLGLSTFARIHQIAKRGKGYADGGPVGTRRTGSGLASALGYTSLSPTDRALLTELISAVRDNRITAGDIKEVARGANVQDATRRAG